MASQEVLSALESLHRELEKLEPAIKHIEAAQEVMKSAKSITSKHHELIEDVKKSDTSHKRELLKIFDQEIKILGKENKELSDNTKRIQAQLNKELTEMTLLREAISEFYVRIEKINFPERMDKLDANISGIMAAVQSIQSRLDILETNITYKLRDLNDTLKSDITNLKQYFEHSFASFTNKQNETQVILQNSIKENERKQKLLIYVTWGIIILVGIGTFALKYFKFIK